MKKIDAYSNRLINLLKLLMKTIKRQLAGIKETRKHSSYNIKNLKVDSSSIAYLPTRDHKSISFPNLF